MNPWGHEYLTEEAIKAALTKLPQGLDWIRHFVADVGTGSVYRDSEDVFTLGHWRNSGQRHHFMRYAGQGEKSAYLEGCDWIYRNAYQASGNLRRIWKEKLGHYNVVFVTEPLGNALHALQDSYALAHCMRRKVGDTAVIYKINVYDEQNKKPGPNWPGHSVLDAQYKDGLGKEAIIASRELIRIVIHCSLVKEDVMFEPKWRSLWQTFAGIFLSTSL